MPQQTWRLLVTDPAPGDWNMAIDEAIAESHRREQSPPTLRLYAWTPACLSIGSFQSLEDEVDVERCRAIGIDLVRRPSGGRAVLHDAEWTYSVAMAEANPIAEGGIKESYRRISLGLVAALCRLGAPASLQPPRRKQAGEPRTGACFDSPSDYEVLVDGRKLVGSAQFRRRGMVLQHGSILTGDTNGKLCSLLRLAEEERAALLADLQERTICLGEVIGRPVGAQEMAQAMHQGFVEALDIELAPGELSAEELSLADSLVKTKYGTREWNYRR